jgi:hypothetical protein
MTDDVKTKHFYVTMEAGEFRSGGVRGGGIPGRELVEWCDTADEACELCAELNAVLNEHRVVGRRPTSLLQTSPHSQATAAVNDFDDQQARLPPNCRLWGNFGDGRWRVMNCISAGHVDPGNTPKEAVDKFLASSRVKG